jgi:hypothetical protein
MLLKKKFKNKKGGTVTMNPRDKNDQNVFTNCVDKWHSLTVKEQENNNKKAKGKSLSGFNYFMSKCQLDEKWKYDDIDTIIKKLLIERQELLELHDIKSNDFKKIPPTELEIHTNKLKELMELRRQITTNVWKLKKALAKKHEMKEETGKN